MASKEEKFIEKAKAKHGDKYDYSNLNYQSLDKDITFICPVHGEVTQKAKSHLVRSGCILCDQEKAKKKRKGGKYAKDKGTNYENVIKNELKSVLNIEELYTSRSESKRMDDNKIDLVGDLPFYVQCKCTKNTPNYFKIESECPLKDRPFVLFWNRQEVKEGSVNMSSVGQLVMLPKEYFYELISKESR